MLPCCWFTANHPTSPCTRTCSPSPHRWKLGSCSPPAWAAWRWWGWWRSGPVAACTSWRPSERWCRWTCSHTAGSGCRASDTSCSLPPGKKKENKLKSGDNSLRYMRYEVFLCSALKDPVCVCACRDLLTVTRDLDELIQQNKARRGLKQLIQSFVCRTQNSGP